MITILGWTILLIAGLALIGCTLWALYLALKIVHLLLASLLFLGIDIFPEET